MPSDKELIDLDLRDEIKAMLYQDFGVIPSYDYAYDDLRIKNSLFYIALYELDRNLYLPFYYKGVYLHAELF